MKHYFLDTNVVIDYLAQRPPFWPDAAELMQAGVNGEARLYVSSLSFTNIYYILRRATSAQQAWQLLWNLEQLVDIVTVDATTIRQALIMNAADFEDAVQYFAALSASSMSAIVTRDPKGFSLSDIPVLLPAQALAELDSNI
jgi:predicted nucleic acid-binding protein